MLYFFFESFGPKLSDAFGKFVRLLHFLTVQHTLSLPLSLSRIQHRSEKSSWRTKCNRNISTKANKWDNQCWTMAWVASFNSKISAKSDCSHNDGQKCCVPFSLRVRNITFSIWMSRGGGGDVVCFRPILFAAPSLFQSVNFTFEHPQLYR